MQKSNNFQSDDNGLGDRHQQNGVNYTLDLNTGLTQVLSDGTNTYMYGNGRIAQRALNTEYFLLDALGSVRQLADPLGAVTLTQSYAPYGETVSSLGGGYSRFKFTGEAVDANGLTYLRARYLDNGTGRFTQRDPSGLEANLYVYAGANPIRNIDPTGLWYISPSYEKIFRDMIRSSKNAYSKTGSHRNCITTPDDGQHPTDTIDDLFTDFVCEYGPAIRNFDYNDPITIEVAQSSSVARRRTEFYTNGGERYIGMGVKMGGSMFLESKFIDIFNHVTLTSFKGFDYWPLSVMDYIGGYDWVIERTARGTVRFTIEDEKNLMSATRFPFAGDNGAIEISLEEYVNFPSMYNINGSSTIDPNLLDSSQYSIISVLANKPSEYRNPSKLSGIGGGTMSVRFSWEERYVPAWTCGGVNMNPMYPKATITKFPIPDSRLLPSGG